MLLSVKNMEKLGKKENPPRTYKIIRKSDISDRYTQENKNLWRS